MLVIRRLHVRTAITYMCRMNVRNTGTQCRYARVNIALSCGLTRLAMLRSL